MIEYVSKLDPDDRGRALVGRENKGEAEPTVIEAPGTWRTMEK